MRLISAAGARPIEGAARLTVPEHSPPRSCLAVSASDFAWGCHSRNNGYRVEQVVIEAVQSGPTLCRSFITSSWLIIGMYVRMATYVRI